MQLKLISILLVLPGAFFLLAAILRSKRMDGVIPPDMEFKWRALSGLMFFFFAGYISFLIIQAMDVSFALDLLVGLVFFGGGMFVFMVISLTRATILRIVAGEKSLAEVNQALRVKNVDMEKEITARRHAETQAGARLRRVETLHAIDLLITSSLDLQVTMRVFLEQVIPQLGVDAAAILLLNRHTQTLEFEVDQGFRGSAIQKFRERLGAGSAGIAAMERRVVHLQDLPKKENDFSRYDLVEEEGFVDYIAVPLIAKGQVRGVLEIFHRSSLGKEGEWFDFLNTVAVQAAMAIDNANLFNELQMSNSEMILAYDTTIEGWARALELRDQETQGHTQRVTDITLQMAEAKGLKSEQLVHIRRGALLHDIGKMGISDDILLKEGPLTEEEQNIMKRHPVYAFELLSPITYLQPALDIPYCHHEKWDGTGYPRGLSGESIPLAARIFAIADVWDALTSTRRYHPAWSRENAAAHIRSLAGIHFDPELVALFDKIIQ